ncbi:MAG: arginine--tRNA ligase [Thermodesulfobacteriota bacterium]
MKKRLDALLKSTLTHCFEHGTLVPCAAPDYVIEVPNNPEHGHFATNLALTLASSQRRSPREIAQSMVENLVDHEGLLEAAEVAGPGFINFKIAAKEWCRILSEAVRLKADYGRSDTGRSEHVLVEFVSANPTGPLHLGHGRGAALGDTLCRVLSFCGYQVVREFYINDAGMQINMLGESIWARFRQMEDPAYPFPENGYHGDYVRDLARKIAGESDLNSLSAAEARAHCARRGKEIMLAELRDDLKRFRVSFDVWSSESDLYRTGCLEETLKVAKEKGVLYEHEGALWIKTSDFGDDKDRVIRKGDGEFTYFASDIAYHLEKHQKRFTKAINIWGADHHGYVPRMKAALATHGISPEWLSVMLIQLVKLWEDGREIKMSKRAGSFVTLKELMDEVGVDAIRFVFLTKHHDSPLDFDLNRVKKQDSDNPVYYVQYAHARICSIFRKAEAAGLTVPDQFESLSAYLVLDEELALIRMVAAFPSRLEDIARSLEPHRLTYYLTELAASFHRYFNLGVKVSGHRILTDDPDLSQARLCLAQGIKIVIANGLRLLGVSAPETM